MIRRLALCVAIATILTTGCASKIPEVPPLSTSGVTHPGKVVWHDLVTPDLDGAKAFYGSLFGWVFEDVNSEYTLIRHNAELIGGMSRLKSSKYASYWVPLVSVPDVEETVAAATESGAERLVKPFDVPGRGKVAVVSDPHGAVFGLVTSSRGDPVDRKPPVNQWMWHEVWTEDVTAAGSFYRDLLGYELKQKTVQDVSYRFMANEGLPRVGLIAKPDPEIGNTWVAYIRVNDAAAVAKRAEEMGAAVLLSPRDDVRNGTVAIIRDPHGAGFIVQEMKGM